MNRNALVIHTSCAILAGILIVMSIFAFLNGKQMYEFNTGIACAAFCFVPSLLYHFNIMKLPPWISACIHLAIFLHALGVLIFAYDTLVFYDSVTHTYSSFVISMCVSLTLFCLQRYNSQIRLTKSTYVLLIILVMASFGVIWEFFEFIVDALFPGMHMQYSPWDTIRDMLSNVIGSVICSAFLFVYLRKKSIDELVDEIDIHPVLRKFLGEKRKK